VWMIRTKEREVNAMNAQRRGFPFFPAVLLVAAVAIVVAAALTTWWVLLALVPLTMMLGCAAMMASHGPMSCAPSARRGCCAGGAVSGEAPHERSGAQAPGA
jgi:hypothetical protein